MATNGTQNLPPLLNLPLSVVDYMTRLLYKEDPAALVQLANATPEIFFSDVNNLALEDARWQVLYGIQPPGSQPLFTLAIHMRESSTWFIERFLNALAETHQDAINGIFPSGRSVEPPLHSAIRAGRPDITHLLLSRYPTLQLDIVYQQNISPLQSCRLAKTAHQLPCGKPVPASRGLLVWSPCELATRAAVGWYARETSRVIRRGIEDASILAISAGQYPLAMNNRGYEQHMMDQALSSGMWKWIQAVVQATLLSPPTFPARIRLLEDGFASIVRSALMYTRASDFIQWMIIKAGTFGADPFRLMENPLDSSFPLSAAHPFGLEYMPNALVVLRYLMDTSGPIGGLKRLLSSLVGARMKTRVAMEDEVHQLFLLEIEAIDMILGREQELDSASRTLAQNHLNEVAKLAFSSGASGLTNTRHLIHNRGYNDRTWLAMAIMKKNILAMNEILAYFDGDLEGLHAKLTFTHRFLPSLTALHACLEYRFPSGVVALLNMGVRANSAPPRAWMACVNDIRQDYDNYLAGSITTNAMVVKYYATRFMRLLGDISPQIRRPKGRDTFPGVHYQLVVNMMETEFKQVLDMAQVVSSTT